MKVSAWQDDDADGKQSTVADEWSPVVSTSPVITNEDELRSLLRATLNAYPEMAGRFDADATMEKLQTWGVCSLDSLDAVLCDSAMVSELAAYLAPACPRVFVSLLRAQLEEEDGEEGGERGGGATEKDAATDWKKATASAPPVPSMMARFLWALRGSLLEFMVPPDHMPWFKQHWIESRRDDSATLKEEFLFLAELELLFGSLLFGALLGGFYSVGVDDAAVQAFRRVELDSFGFWAAAVGGVAVTLSTLQIATSYVTIFLFLPIHPENFYAFVKTTSIQRYLNLGTILIVMSFYALTTFLMLATCSVLGASWLVLLMTFGVGFVAVFPAFLVLSTNALNLAMWSGVFGPEKVVSDADAARSDCRASDDKLARIALANVRKYGKPVPPRALYGAADDKEGTASTTAKGEPRKAGRRHLRKKLMSHALASHAHAHTARMGMF